MHGRITFVLQAPTTYRHVNEGLSSRQSSCSVMASIEEFDKPLIVRSWSYREAEIEEHADDKMTLKKYEDEALVAVMGVTGAGKSSFISLLSDQDIKIGHDLESSTTDAQLFSFNHGSGSGFLIDTPGFDDTSRSNTDILKEIAGFFCNLYAKGLRLDGIIYLHRISDPRMSGSAIKNLEIFQRLCGMQGFPNVVLVTTMWNELQQQSGSIVAGERREQELKTTDTFWANMISRGSRTMRHTGDRQSAMTILSSILATHKKFTLDIQTEMIDQGLPLDLTTAGKYLRQDYADLVHKYKIEADEMRQSKLAAIDDRDKEMVMVMDEEILKLTDEISKAKKADEMLNLDFQVLQDEKSRSFPQRANRNASVNSESTASSSKESDADPRKLEELIRTMEEQHRAELESLEEQHRSQILREKRRLGAQAKNVSAENEVLADLVHRYDKDRRELYQRNKELVNQARIEKQRQEAYVQQPPLRRRPPLPPRPQLRDGSDQAVAAAKRAWQLQTFVWLI